MRPGNSKLHSQFVAILIALLAVTGLSLTSINEVTWEQRALAFVMFALSGCSYARWRYDAHRALPVYALISGSYTLFFALALFWVTPVSPSYFDQGALLPQEAVTGSLRMVVLGLIAIWIGMRAGLARHLITVEHLPDVPASRLHSPWIRWFVAFGSLSGFLQGMAVQFGALQNAVQLLFTFVPLVPFAILLDRYWAGAATKTDKLLITVFLIGRVTGGLAAGSLSSLVSAGLLVPASYLRARRTLPWIPVMIGILAVLFLQPGKNEYRQRFWYGADEATALARGAYWIHSSWNLWSSFFFSADPTVFTRLASMSVERASLLSQAALVAEKTPT